ncbi:MAG TPA: ribonucleoside-diphosphate reductase subunit alpha, partial [Gammaproteobacteria bacterium]|nr:ribonucleoside-diphosphate reductase subunit alpha [Gammaproteobacteria bacterium]
MENVRETQPIKETEPVQQEKETTAITPGQMRVIKRNGSVVPYNQEKIAIAITKAFLAVEGGAAAASTRIHNKVNELANSVTITFSRRMPSGGTLHIEEIQDQVELELMRSEERTVARSYVLYREERKKVRKEETGEEEQHEKESGIKVVLDDGSESTLD